MARLLRDLSEVQLDALPTYVVKTFLKVRKISHHGWDGIRLFWKKKKREGVSVFAEFTPFSLERVGIKQGKLTLFKTF